MHHHNRHPARYSRIHPRQPGAVPQGRIPLLEVPEVPASGPALVPRAPAPSSGSDESSTSGEKPTSTTTTTTLPVVLGAVVPIVCAIVILVYLHRRNVRRLRNEDANDKHKSLDFGLDIVDPPYKGMPMQESEKGARVNHTKGVSLDIGHPYLMPPGLHGSQESFNSLPKSIGGEQDRYRHAVSVLASDSASVRSHPRAPPNAASPANNRSNAQKSMLNDPSQAGLHFDFPPSTSPSPGPFDNHERYSAASSSDVTAAADLRKSNSHLASAIHRNSLPSDPFKHPDEAEISDDDSLHHHDSPIQEPAPVHLQQATPAVPTPRISLPVSDAGSDYSNHRKTTASIPAVNISGAEDTQASGHEASSINPPPIPDEPQSQPSKNPSLDPRRDTRRMTFGLRPLPPEDPADNPEQRANRIRSFYKEYFDDSKAGRETIYYEDFGPEFYSYPDDVAHDPHDDYYAPPPAPFAEPVTRRAMTPPPRAPPPFQPGGHHMPSGSASGFSGFSSGFGDPGPRAMSSASNRMSGPLGAPRKPAPPPAPLNLLPTPHMLKDDSLMSAIDFAPSGTFKDQKEGRAETPLGGRRPFSPMTRAATPLASAFDDLSVMPSPHALRNSGAFTNLDFAPPPRFKNTETASDAGSIRSNGTGLSNAQLYNLRNGAYRVSRLPTSTVGTKDDMFSELRPKWEMRT